jgi:hypothetical protein
MCLHAAHIYINVYVCTLRHAVCCSQQFAENSSANVRQEYSVGMDARGKNANTQRVSLHFVCGYNVLWADALCDGEQRRQLPPPLAITLYANAFFSALRLDVQFKSSILPANEFHFYIKIQV